MNPFLPTSNLLTPIAILVPIVLALPPSRTILEAGLVGHMLVQLPLLGAAGFAAGIVTRPQMRRQLLWWDRGGITGLVTFLFISLFWMLPRSIDAVLLDFRYELGKFASVPAAGVALAWSYHRAHVILKGAILAHVISAFGAMSWLFCAAPVRLCNSYLRGEQELAGLGFLVIGLALSVHTGIRLLFSDDAVERQARPAVHASPFSHVTAC